MTRYRLVIRGRLGDRLTDLFADLEVRPEGDDTALTGDFADQAQLHGVLERLRVYGIELVSVTPQAGV